MGTQIDFFNLQGGIELRSGINLVRENNLNLGKKNNTHASETNYIYQIKMTQN